MEVSAIDKKGGDDNNSATQRDIKNKPNIQIWPQLSFSESKLKDRTLREKFFGQLNENWDIRKNNQSWKWKTWKTKMFQDQRKHVK